MRLIEEAELDVRSGAVRRVLNRVETDDSPPRYAFVDAPLFRKVVEIQRASGDARARSLLSHWSIHFSDRRDEALAEFDARPSDDSEAGVLLQALRLGTVSAEIGWDRPEQASKTRERQ